MKLRHLLLVVLAGLAGALSAFAAAPPIAIVQKDAAGVSFIPLVEYESITLTVASPSGEVWRNEFARGRTIRFTPAIAGGLDGSYGWQLVASPRLTDEAKGILRAARETGDMSAVERMRADGKLPRHEMVQSGDFGVLAGLVLPDQEEPDANAAVDAPPRAAAPSQSAGSPSKGLEPNDMVIADDLIVQSSLCAGLDCVDAESFGFTTIRMKENNTRIEFQDTSTGTFPTHDWWLVANDSASGAAERFYIQDLTSSTTPFSLAGSSPNNSIFVDGSGRVGFKTSTPVLELHTSDTDSPALRLEQNNAGGFTAQTWDIAGNEANFFVRDVTGGSLLPFKIIPGAPTNSLRIESSGNVTMGADLTLAGVLHQGSSRAIKTSFSLVDGRALLERLTAMPISTWSYLKDSAGTVHLGPTAEDFHAAFGLGPDDAHIAPSDAAGIALAAAQQLACEIDARQGEIARLERENAALAERLARVEAALAALVAPPGDRSAGR